MYLLPRIKEAQNFGLFLYFSKKLPKGNSFPNGENSPHLVTLIGASRCVGTGRQSNRKLGLLSLKKA
jgi:hypothetical protein